MLVKLITFLIRNEFVDLGKIFCNFALPWPNVVRCLRKFGNNNKNITELFSKTSKRNKLK